MALRRPIRLKNNKEQTEVRMFNVILCNENPQELDKLIRWVEPFNRGVPTRVLPFSNAYEMYDYLLAHGDSVHLVISDTIGKSVSIIHLMELAQEQLPDLPVIFASRHSDHVFDCYSVRHIDFLCFSLNQARLLRALNRAFDERVRNTMRFVSFGGHSTITRIALSDILYMESDLHNIHVYTHNGKKTFSGRLDSINPSLDFRFIRCHKSYMVNMDYVQMLTGERMVLLDGTQIPISSSRKRITQDAFNAYVYQQSVTDASLTPPYIPSRRMD